MIVILMGKSASGKDTQRKCLEEYGAIPMVSSTTRGMREGEIQGREYNFISEKEFLDKVQTGDIFEYREYDSSNGTVYYGSEKIRLEGDKDYIKVLDPDGARAFINAYGRDNCFVVYLDVPKTVRYSRALIREGNAGNAKFEQEWNKRAKDDDERFMPDKVDDLVNFRLTLTGNEQDISNPYDIAEYITRTLYDFKRKDKDIALKPQLVEGLCSLENGVGNTDKYRKENGFDR